MEVQGPCIYRVPSRIRDVKPEAYTPRMVVIGPLHRSPKSTAIDGPETSSTPWHLKKEYIKMEVTKKTYIESYTQRVGQDTIEEMRKTIQAEEVNLRASYEESTEWIPSQYFVELILQDSVFIMEFFLRFMQRQDYSDDKIVHMPFYSSMVRHDLVLLENQLPYFILDRLFSSSMVELYMRETLDQFILCNFGLTMEEKTNFRHFTDMFRCVYEESLDDIPKQMNTYPNRWPPITELRNADNLFQAGVDFKSSDILIQTYEKYEASERKHGPGILQRTMTVVHKERPVRKRHLKKEYIKMEVTKKTYIESYTQRVGQDTIEEMRKTIQAEEVNLRASYEESTEWIPSQYFVELILQDSVFIMEFFLRFMQRQDYSDDKIVHMPFYSSMVRHDLVLLENQLPYFILDRLFSSSMVELYMRETLDQFILCNFGLTMEEKTNFRHFTDMFRCVYEESLDDIPKQMNTYPNRWPPITELRNADNLFQAGVDFKSSDILIQTYEKYEASERKHGPGILQRTMTVVHKERPVRKRDRIPGFSLDVEFENGILTMPGFHANEVSDMYLRNVVAFEQCHVSVIPFTSNYIHFLNFLISFDRDVEVLIEEGVVTNTMGRLSLVVDMVNKLQVGVKVGTMSQYHDISMKLKAHYKSRRKRCWATLNKVYFSDLWTGTATIAAVLLLFMTLVGTVASVIQTYKSF